MLSTEPNKIRVSLFFFFLDTVMLQQFTTKMGWPNTKLRKMCFVFCDLPLSKVIWRAKQGENDYSKSFGSFLSPPCSELFLLLLFLLPSRRRCCVQGRLGKRRTLRPTERELESTCGTKFEHALNFIRNF